MHESTTTTQANSTGQGQVAATSPTSIDSSRVATPPPSPTALSDELLRRMLSGTLGPLENLSEAIGTTLDEVSGWMANHKNRRKVTNLITLLDVQSQLLAGQHRVYAIAKLVQLIHDDAPPETARRACADLLKLRLIDPYKEEQRPAPVEKAPWQIKIEEQMQRDMMRLCGMPKPGA